METKKNSKNSTASPKALAARQHLAETALKLFAEKGFEKTTMRDLAKEAGVSLGHFYYHFSSKEEIVNVFYLETLSEIEEACKKLKTETKKFEERYIGLVRARMKTFERQRSLVIAISGVAVDPKSPLSPFGPATKEIRLRTIGLIEDLINDSDFRCGEKIAPYAPTLLWHLMMGFIFYWVFDSSRKQARTDELTERLTPLVLKLMRASRLPLAGTVLRPIHTILNDFIPLENRDEKLP